MEKAQVIASVCGSLAAGSVESAAAILDRDYPFAAEVLTRRHFRPLEYTRAFVRDGFVDRYTGKPLVFPPVLRLLSHALPERFPYHPNWKDPGHTPGVLGDRRYD